MGKLILQGGIQFKNARRRSMKDMFLEKNLWLSLITFKLRDRSFSKSQKLHIQGFTLIELLVVIIIIGILAAIALPSFLNQANKARFAEAKSYIGTMSRLQQAYYLEKQIFADNVGRLGASESSASYTYAVLAGDVDGNATPVQLNQIVTLAAQPLSNTITLNAFVGVVGIPGAVKIDTIFCIANSSSTSITPGSVDFSAQTMKCPNAFFLP
ncbi:MAG: type IV pilin-like G/H family protein [Pseudanabaena sp. CAN_BIN31]|nr:type IV pilin-like G/H family protein [Pseudanabaena sp. CAN_BIN31]